MARKNPQYPDSVVVERGTNPRYRVIWLHGLGADGHDFEPIVPQLPLGSTLETAGVRFIFPHAASIPVTINGGARMPAWYDIRGLDLRRDQDAEGIAASSARISAMLDAEIAAGIKPEEIILAGFSQGGAMALHVGLRYRHRLAGLIALSCYLLFAGQLEELQNPPTAGLPVFAAHGIQDPVVPFAVGKAAADELARLGYAVEWRAYPMPHAVCPREIQDIGEWLSQRLA